MSVVSVIAAFLLGAIMGGFTVLYLFKGREQTGGFPTQYKLVSIVCIIAIILVAIAIKLTNSNLLNIFVVILLIPVTMAISTFALYRFQVIREEKNWSDTEKVKETFLPLILVVIANFGCVAILAAFWWMMTAMLNPDRWTMHNYFNSLVEPIPLVITLGLVVIDVAIIIWGGLSGEVQKLYYLSVPLVAIVVAFLIILRSIIVV